MVHMTPKHVELSTDEWIKLSAGHRCILIQYTICPDWHLTSLCDKPTKQSELKTHLVPESEQKTACHCHRRRNKRLGKPSPLLHQPSICSSTTSDLLWHRQTSSQATDSLLFCSQLPPEKHSSTLISAHRLKVYNCLWFNQCLYLSNTQTTA